MRVTMLLADAAEESGGKLYILGGGWSINRGGGAPFNMALAIKIEVPWNEANRPHRIVAELLTEDGQPAQFGGNAIRIEGQLEVGRPVGLPAGTPLDAPMALNLAGIQLDPGGYRWQLSIDGNLAAETSFRVIAAQATQAAGP